MAKWCPLNPPSSLARGAQRPHHWWLSPRSADCIGCLPPSRTSLEIFNLRRGRCAALSRAQSDRCEIANLPALELLSSSQAAKCLARPEQHVHPRARGNFWVGDARRGDAFFNDVTGHQEQTPISLLSLSLGYLGCLAVQIWEPVTTLGGGFERAFHVVQVLAVLSLTPREHGEHSLSFNRQAAKQPSA